jgi:GNAT superfamily N-acetyltransferase
MRILRNLEPGKTTSFSPTCRSTGALWSLVAIGQIKPHGDGSRELAAIAVVPEWQDQGIATAIIHAMLARDPGPLYLVYAPEPAEFYARFGFHREPGARLPAYLRRLQRLVEFLSRLARPARPAAPQILGMYRQGPWPHRRPPQASRRH